LPNRVIGALNSNTPARRWETIWRRNGFRHPAQVYSCSDSVGAAWAFRKISIRLVVHTATPHSEEVCILGPNRTAQTKRGGQYRPIGAGGYCRTLEGAIGSWVIGEERSAVSGQPEKQPRSKGAGLAASLLSKSPLTSLAIWAIPSGIAGTQDAIRRRAPEPPRRPLCKPLLTTTTRQTMSQRTRTPKPTHDLPRSPASVSWAYGPPWWMKKLLGATA
jgi:hypothetical protein